MIEALKGNRKYMMYRKFFVIFNDGASFPEREHLISQTWGDLPVSYIQDHVDPTECQFLDLKINKWEMNASWSRQLEDEPWIRIESYKDQALCRLLESHNIISESDTRPKSLITLELDEGGGPLDEMLLMRLASFFRGHGKVYGWLNGPLEIEDSFFSSLATQHWIRKQIARGC